MDLFTVNNAKTALSLIELVAGAVSKANPDMKVGGIKLDKIVAVGTAAAEGSKDAADYIARLKALTASTTDPTPEQWATLDAETAQDVQHLLDSTK